MPTRTSTSYRRAHVCQCRLRKRRCGGQPPDACTNCLRSDETCKWAAEDGRSSAVRKGKANVALPSMDTAQLLAQLQRALQNGNGQGWPRTTGSLNAGACDRRVMG